MALHACGLTQLLKLLKKRETSPFEVASDLLSAIDSRNQAINAYLEVYREDLLEQAKRLTERGTFRDDPLFGIPIAVKDNICVKGRRTTCGSRMLESFRSPYHATAVERLLSAGALIVGRTNMDEFGMGSSTENSAFGPTRNPWNSGCVPGGSSGGSAAAVSADIAFAALGSDTGGSIRQPACLCGVVGMKPTYGRVSRYGLVAFASSLDQIGPIAKNVQDCAALLSVLCGHDPLDATSLRTRVPDFSGSLESGLEGLRVGIPWDFLETEMDPDVKRNFEWIIGELQALNVPLLDISLPHAKDAVACYYTIANAEASANLARFDGVRYGYRSKAYADLYEMYTRSRGEGFGEEVKRRILLGTYVLSAGYYDAHYLQAQKVRSLLIGDFQAVFERCDMVMLPTSPTPAFKLGEKISDPLLMYLSDIFTIPANLAGLPGISLPSGLSRDRLPTGVQLIGKALDEETVLKGAYGMEKVIGFRENPPEHSA